jgi:splicing factor U2AF subunit
MTAPLNLAAISNVPQLSGQHTDLQAQAQAAAAMTMQLQQQPQQSGKMELDVTKLGIISTQVPDGPNKVFCGGLPYNLTEPEVKELVSVYGQLKAFHLVKERDSQTSKGYCFFEYANPDISDEAIKGLNGLELRGKTLTVRRAQPRAGGGGGTAANSGGASGGMLASILGMGGMGGMGLLTMGLPQLNPMMPNLSLVSSLPAQQPTRVLVLMSMVVPEELTKDDEYKDIVDDIDSECQKYGIVKSVVIPRPAEGKVVPGLGKVFVEFEAPEHASKAKNELEGRQFAGRTVLASFLAESKYAARDFTE